MSDGSQAKFDQSMKNKSSSESNIMKIVKSLSSSDQFTENESGSYRERDMKNEKLATKIRTNSASLIPEKVVCTSSSLIYSKDGVDEEVSVPAIDESVSSRNDMFRITRIVVRTNEAKFEEKVEVVKFLNEQMEDYWINCKL